MTKARVLSEAGRSVERIDVIGADANNLKHVDVRIPMNQVTVVTGVSGSGKSSLLSDTLGAEADRRMRVFLGIAQPHLEGGMPHAFIGPMPPAIHVGQRAFRASARTTIGTATGLLTTLRRLFIACSKPYSDELGRFILPASPASYAAWLITHYRGRATVSAVPAYLIATDGVRHVEQLRALGIAEVVIRSETDSVKAWERGRTVPTAKFKPLRPTVRHIIEANFGTVEIKPRTDHRKLEQTLQRAFDAGQGKVFVDVPDATQPELRGPFGPRLDSTLHDVDPDLPTCFFRPNPHLLSFNAPEHSESGACKTCLGLGRATILDEQALVSHPERSMHKGAFSLWTDKNYKYVNIQHETIEGLRGMHGFSPDTPWSKLSEEARRLVLDGAGKELVTDKDRTTGRRMSAPRPFEGFRHAILSRYAKGTKASESLAFLICQGPCPDCDGTRWSYQARALRIGGIGIQHILAKPFIDLVAFTQDGSDFVKAVPPRDSALVRVLHHRAAAFVSLGLGHLTGDRGMPDVSEGESRRARLAAVLNAHHAGLCMLLDEPARGLHDEDVQNMTSAVTELARMHTVVVNEHRHAFAGAANHVIELGPGAGDAGGEVVYAGPVAQSSWAKELVIERERPHPRSKNPAVLAIRGATIHNLEGVDCTIPLGRLTCLTGVSGSGKSNFVRGILVPAVARSLPSPMQLDDFDQRQGTWSSFDGVERIKGMVALDQKAPPPNRRSIVATLLGVADPIRTAFGASPEARRASLSASDFGLNAGRGRCQHCLGIGEVEEHDQWTPCPVCGGTRFGQEALSVRVGGVNINEVLNAPIANLTGRAPVFLSEYLPVLTAMVDLGIGHVALGRRLDTLSGGEIQRLRIATKLAEHGSGGLLFVLDEPAAGLHPRDVERLVGALDRILDHGKNTVVLVEHNPAIIRAADWLIEFGPGSGPHGGRVVASGTPEEVRKTDTATGRVLSNKPAPLHPRQLSSSSTKQQAHHEPRVLEQQAERMKAWIRHLIGDDVARPDDGADGDATDRPVAALDDHFWQGRRAWEIGGLDLEIAKLLLDVQARRATADDITSLAQEWTKHRDARLVIQPFLKDIQVWGARLPASTVGEASAHIRSMGLDLIDADGSGVKRGNPDWPGIRATGDRFNPRDGSLDERRRAIADALTLGGGYAELRGPRGVCCGWFGHRLLDLEHGIVAPMIPVPVHFSRHNRAGQCPMCRGNGHVMTLKEELVIGDRRATPEADGFLHASAATVMKGVRRSELIPFLRRLEEEGLWDRSAPYQRLDPSARDLLFFGCWTRPGHGTFLKSAKEDPSEVGAWLRWDGLYHALWGQFERSTDARWREAVKQSRSTRTCPSCEGTGLAAHGKLLRLGDRSLYEWVRDGTAGDFGEALKSLKTSAPRQKRTRERILTCLAPLVEREGSQPFHAMVEDDLGREISRRVVEAFTDMPVVFT